MATLKVLTVGSVRGSFRTFFSKVKAFDAKHGKFELVLATGDFFASPGEDGADSTELTDLLEEKLEVPIQILIMQGRHPLPQIVINKIEKSGGIICSNVSLLSKAGVFLSAQGLKIACLGGIYTPQEFYGKSNGRDFSNPYFTSALLKQLLNQPALNPGASNPNSLAAMKNLSNTRFIDILVTNIWPTSITDDITTLPPGLEPELAPQLNELVKVAKPRYYFSASGKFWEREPFCWPEENNRTTRFITLGDFAAATSEKKERWYYAVSVPLVPPPSTPQPQPPNVSRNPFLDDLSAEHGKRSLDQTLDGEDHVWGNVEKRFKGADTGRHERTNTKGRPAEGYVCRICGGTDHFIGDCPKKRPLNSDGTRKPPEGYVCRACASDQHYIKDCPIAQTGPREWERPRGPPREIQPDECWFCLSNPNLAKHLIVSIGNEIYVTLPRGQLPPTQTSKPSPAAPVPGGGHVLIVPIAHYPTLSSIPEDLWPPIRSDIEQIKSALRSCYAKYDASPVIFEVSRLSGKGGHAHVQVVPVPNKHTSEDIEKAFRSYGQQIGVELEDDTENTNLRRTENYFRVELPNGRTLIHMITGSFDLQFGRIALAYLLGVHQRMDWKQCIQSEEEDKLDVEAFKKVFAPLDPLQ